MEEFKKKWFQNVWLCLVLASVTITYIQRWSDAQWAHGAGIEMLNTVLTWIILPLTVILLVCKYIGYWRQGERLFWKKCRRWGLTLALGVVCAVVLVLVVRYVKGESGTISDSDRIFILSVFAAGGLMWGVARYKFKHWRRDE